MTYIKNGVRYMSQDEFERRVKDGNYKLPDRWEGKLKIVNDNGKIRLEPTDAFKNGAFLPESPTDNVAGATIDADGNVKTKEENLNKTIKGGKIYTRDPKTGKWVKGNHKIEQKSSKWEGRDRSYIHSNPKVDKRGSGDTGTDGVQYDVQPKSESK